MKIIARAGISSKVKSRAVIKLTIIATIAVIGVVFSAFSIFNAQYLFAVLYFFAATLGCMYFIIKLNTILPLQIECDGENLYLTTWDNCLFSHNINFKPVFFADFVPAKIKCIQIPLKEISSVVIGSRGFINRTLREALLTDSCFDNLPENKRLDDMSKRMDIFYAILKDGSTYYMSINDFDINEIYDVADTVCRYVPGFELKTNIRKLRKKWEAGSAAHN